ncbi:hypothetical protein Bbelb_023560 [Branchiostoma belcheri]|nr:hypothetical protein Bbelb_023560 [Branchiostoma belcheri]
MEGNATVYPSVAGFDVPRSPDNDSSAGWNGTDWGEAAGSYNFVALLPILVIVEILTGNALVVVAIYKGKNLRSTTNYFIVNLAVTDALMAVLVMPFVVYVEEKRQTESDIAAPRQSARLHQTATAGCVTGCPQSAVNALYYAPRKHRQGRRLTHKLAMKSPVKLEDGGELYSLKMQGIGLYIGTALEHA